MTEVDLWTPRKAPWWRRWLGLGRSSEAGVIREGHAMRVLFFYPNDEGTYIDDPYVRLYANGVIHIQSQHEETTVHLQNCEILWRYEYASPDDRTKLRLIKKGEREPGVPEVEPNGSPQPPSLQ